MDLSVTRTDFVVYIYNAAVVLSGTYAVTFFGIRDRFVMLGLAAVIAVFWTIYFKYSMRARFAEITDRQAARDREEPDDAA